MKTLFNEYEAQNNDGKALSNEIEFAIHPIIVKYWKQGFTLREISMTIIMSVTSLISELILKNAIDMRKKNRMER